MLDIHEKSRRTAMPRLPLDPTASTPGVLRLQDPFAPAQLVDAAWARYCNLACQAACWPDLLDDPAYAKAMAHAHSHFERLFAFTSAQS